MTVLQLLIASRSSYLFIAILLFNAVLFHGHVNAFFPADWKENVAGLGGISHESMTRDVIEDILIGDDSYFPGEITTLTTYMGKARDEIAEANKGVDDDESHDSAAHFDAENFPGGQDRLVVKAKAVVDALAELDGTLARLQLGQALHTIQDFYAHTNWVEMLQPDPHPNLGKEDSPIVFSDIDDPTCTDCKGAFDLGCAVVCLDGGNSLAGLLASIIAKTAGIILEGVCLAACTCPDCSGNLVHAAGGNALGGDLTSGYYHNEGEEHDAPASGIKCHHGGLGDTSTFSFSSPLQYRAGINKDSLACNWSPHRDFHLKAVGLAKRATRQYIDLIRDQLPDADREKQLRILFGVGPPLAFAIDTTGSMGGYIAAVRTQTIQIVNNRLNTANQPSVFILEPFNDPDIGPTVVTSDGDEFKTALGGLFAAGGGDCPERSMEGMLAALQQLPTGGSLIVITDAAAADPGLADQVIFSAVAKKVKIFLFIFTSPCSEEPAYADIAEATGGQVHSGLDLADASLITELIDVVVTADLSNVAQFAPSHDGPPLDLDDFDVAHITPRRARRSFIKRAVSTPFDTSASIPLDPAMTRVTFSVSGASDISLTRPDGSVVLTTDTGVSVVTLSSGIFITVPTPAAGKWGVKITDCNSCTIAVFGDSTLKFASFDFVVEGGGGHPGFFPIKDPLVPGMGYFVIARLDGDFSAAKFQFRSLQGEVIRDINMEAGTGEEGVPPKNSFFGAVKVPNESFLIYVSGKDAAGNNFVRVLPALVGATPSNGTFNGTNPTNSTSSSSRLPTSSSGPFANSTSTTVTSITYGTGVTRLSSGSGGTAPSSSTLSTSSSGPFANSTSTTVTSMTYGTGVTRLSWGSGGTTSSSGPGGSTTPSGSPGDFEDTTTVIVYTTVSTCPITSTITSGRAISTSVTSSLSTITVTTTSIIPCKKCIGPNYPQNNPTSGVSGIAGPGKTGHGPGPAPLKSTTTVVVLTSLTTCPVTQTLTSGGSTFLQTTYSVSTVLMTKTTVVPATALPVGPSTAPAAPLYGATSPLKSSVTTYPGNVSSGSYVGPMATGGGGRVAFAGGYGNSIVMKLCALGAAVLFGAWLL